MNQSGFLSFLHPALTLRLMIISAFFFLITVGNLLGVYTGIISGKAEMIYSSLIPALLYAIQTYAILRLKPWGRNIILILSCITSLAFGAIITIYVNILIGLFVIVSHGLIAAYMLTQECKKAFHSGN